LIIVRVGYKCATIVQIDIDFVPDGTPVCGLVDLRGASAIAFQSKDCVRAGIVDGKVAEIQTRISKILHRNPGRTIVSRFVNTDVVALDEHV